MREALEGFKDEKKRIINEDDFVYLCRIMFKLIHIGKNTGVDNFIADLMYVTCRL